MELIKGGWYMTVREAMQKWHFAYTAVSGYQTKTGQN